MNTCHVSSDITFFHTNYTHLFSAQSESIDASLTHMPLFSLLQVESPRCDLTESFGIQSEINIRDGTPIL